MFFDLSRRRSPSELAVRLFLALSNVLLAFACPQGEPIAVLLTFSALDAGLNAPLFIACLILAGALTLSLEKAIVYFLSAFVLAVFFLIKRNLAIENRFLTPVPLLICSAVFVWLFPLESYPIFYDLPVYFQKSAIAVFGLVLALLFLGGVRTAEKKMLRCRLTRKEILFVSALFLATLFGLYRLERHVYYAVAMLCLLLWGAVFKPSSAIPFSLLLALPCAVVEESLLPVALFTLLASTSAFFFVFGKFPAASALAITYGLFAYFFGYLTAGTLSAAVALTVVLSPCAVFLLVPQKVYEELKKTLSYYRSETLTRLSLNRNREAVGEKLFNVSEVFRAIENAFIEEDGEKNRENEARKLMRGEIEREVCTGCPGRERCLNADMGTSIDKLIAVGCMKGRASLVDLPKAVTGYCQNANGLLFALNKQLGDYRRFVLEAENQREGRKLLSMQARGVSELIATIALEQSRPLVDDREQEEKLQEAFTKRGVILREVFLSGEGDDILLSLTVFGQYESAMIAKTASDCLGIPLITSEKLILASDKFAYTLRKKPSMDAVFGVTSVRKKGESASGDTHSVLRIDEKRFLCALSDGMGSGPTAKRVSERAMGLLESFYRAGMNEDVILSTVNKLLTFNRNETFVCVDLASVDLATGRADFVKIGSPMGFVFSDGVIRVLEGESLPLGMLDDLTPTTLSVDLKDGDVVIFLSDGVTDAFSSSADLFDYLKTLSPLNPQSFTDEIVETAIKRDNGEAKDDMTALAVRIFKTA